MGHMKSRADRHITIVACVIRMAQAVAALGFVLSPACAEQPKSCRPTLKDFRALEKGMSHAQVETRLGCRGRRGTPVRVGRNTRVDDSWLGHGTFGANIHLTFMNGRLVDKSELGLRR